MDLVVQVCEGFFQVQKDAKIKGLSEILQSFENDDLIRIVSPANNGF